MRIEAANLAGSLWICSVVNHGVQGVGVPSWVPDPELEGAVPKSSALSWTCWLLLEPRLIGALARLLVSSSIWPLSSESDFFFTATCNALTLVSPDEPPRWVDWPDPDVVEEPVASAPWSFSLLFAVSASAFFTFKPNIAPVVEVFWPFSVRCCGKPNPLCNCS
ncbi:hypothetical protein MPNB_3710 [Mycoplasmoides pneumoniae]|uniref:Uncharacterized protein n=1 Tax=Mycoplasmoides pneumoniae 309 TaxID=1112856 RepID=A0AB33HQT4_MYCPM|nr:hypothetical protein MPNA3710 [Mycoplasmoides pneumoniae 309]BAV19867.1 hypothetical protein MPNB_3710 [Mycoplasmoides pneumoniae]BAV20605.1 hypothetical protein MPNC_3710 [Mycoplasmoides pneumoniae]